MKFISLFALILLTQNAFLIAMNSQDKLTDAEQKCLEWYQGVQKLIPCFDKLAPEDQKLFGGELDYEKNRADIESSRKNYVDLFYNTIEEYNTKNKESALLIECDKKTMLGIILKTSRMLNSPVTEKPTTEAQARKDAFRLLTAEQKSAYSIENYKKTPTATENAVLAYKENYIRLVTENKLLAEKEVEENAQRLFEDQMARFKCQYGKPTVN